MNKNRDYCVVILSHGRADRVYTYNTLRRQGYTGDIYIMIDNLDKQKDEYIKRFGEDKVIIFDKEYWMKKVDTVDNFKKPNTVLYARNAIFDEVKKLGYEYFIMLDDDYTSFVYKMDNNFNYINKMIKNLDKVFDILFKYYKENENILTLSIAQGGDFIGGANSDVFKKMSKRKAMNFFFCSVNRRFNFYGTMNDDVNTYILLGSKGKIFLTIAQVSLNQVITQVNPGGLTELYLDNGTYVKSFYSIILLPSAVRISLLGVKYRRLHHFIIWERVAPKIIREEYKKK